MGFVVRVGEDRSGRDLEALAFVGKFFFAPHLRNDARRFFELDRDFVQGCLEGAGFLVGSPFSDSEVDPAFREDVEHGHAFRDLDGVVHAEGQAHHAVPDPDALGATGHEGEKGLRRAHVRVPFEAVVLHGPNAVEAHLFGIDRLVHAFPKDLRFCFSRGVGGLRLEDHGKFHGGPPADFQPSRDSP